MFGSFATAQGRWLGAMLVLALAICPMVVVHAGPVEVQRQLFDALERGDIDAALALFTDDAVIDSQSGDCARAPCVGRAAIRKDLLRYLADPSRRVSLIDTHVAGNVLVTRFEARSATMQRAGVERIVLWGIREMRGDKIATSRCCLPERTDPQTIRFLEWDYAHSTESATR